MQVLYQFDVRGVGDAADILAGLDGSDANEGARQEAFELAKAAWGSHDQADGLASELAPQWPAYRQPPVDRAILRLAYHEMVSGHAPVRVAINEAIELAKAYSAEQSPGFINGVLDKMARQIRQRSAAQTAVVVTPPAGASDAESADAGLDATEQS